MVDPMLALMADESRSRLIKQGAEAKIYTSSLISSSSDRHADKVAMLLKYRFPKTYRHPALTASITASRTQAEARALVRCMRAGVNTPKLLCADERHGVLGLEYILGRSLREALGGGNEDGEVESEKTTLMTEPLLSNEEALEAMALVGTQLARMHHANVIHGDLTTSNMMLREKAKDVDAKSYQEQALVMIDFGLSLTSAMAEDKAVDLYVLQRAFASTHPNSEYLFARILDVYREELDALDGGGGGGQGAKGKTRASVEILRKLDEVRQRGRKRSMVG